MIKVVSTLDINPWLIQWDQSHYFRQRSKEKYLIRVYIKDELAQVH